MIERSAFSRRAMLGATVVSSAAAAQQPAASQPPADEVEAGRRQLRDGYDQMRKTDLPATVEPATVFRP